MAFARLRTRRLVGARLIAGACIALSVLMWAAGARAATPTTTYRSDILAASPVSYWRLGDLSGTVAADELNVNPGTSANVALNQIGALACDANASTGFNGSSSYVTAPSSNSLNITSAV